MDPILIGYQRKFDPDPSPCPPSGGTGTPLARLRPWTSLPCGGPMGGANAPRISQTLAKPQSKN